MHPSPVGSALCTRTPIGDAAYGANICEHLFALRSGFMFAGGGPSDRGCAIHQSWATMTGSGDSNQGGHP
jgi:hypothetical protein